jgi:hypothetical protein
MFLIKPSLTGKTLKVSPPRERRMSGSRPWWDRAFSEEPASGLTRHDDPGRARHRVPVENLLHRFLRVAAVWNDFLDRIATRATANPLHGNRADFQPFRAHLRGVAGSQFFRSHLTNLVGSSLRCRFESGPCLLKQRLPENPLRREQGDRILNAGRRAVKAFSKIHELRG